MRTTLAERSCSTIERTSRELCREGRNPTSDDTLAVINALRFAVGNFDRLSLNHQKELPGFVRMLQAQRSFVQLLTDQNLIEEFTTLAEACAPPDEGNAPVQANDPSSLSYISNKLSEALKALQNPKNRAPFKKGPNRVT